MTDWLETAEELVLSGRIKVPYTWWVGETGSRFLTALRDEQKIMGTYCPHCDLVFMPPRKNCGRCFNQNLSWQEVGPCGTLTTYTTPGYREEIHPLDRPFAYGIIKLDGADTGLTHLVSEFETGQLKCGLRVEPVFRWEGEGTILDIEYFRPI